MASLTSTSGGKIPVDSTETAQRHKSAQLLRSFSRHLAPGPLSLVFPYTLLTSQIFTAREEVIFAGRKHKHIQSQSNTKPQPQQLPTGI